MGGVAFAPDGDVWVDDCVGGGSELHRYDIQGVAPDVNGTKLHPESVVLSDAGCGLANHADGFMYSNTINSGAVQIDASTGAPTGSVFGPAGNALGIASDPQTGDVVYVAQNCRFTGVCDIITVDPATNASSIFVSLPGFNFIDGIFFTPDGSQLFLAKRAPGFAVTIVDRDAPGARTGSFNRDIALPAEPDDIAFHADGFVVTANLNGTMSRIDFNPDTVSSFASGGFRNDLSQVGSDGCLYTTQAGTRYDDGTVTGQNSVVRICPGFIPPVADDMSRMTGGGSIVDEAEGRVTHGFGLHCDASNDPNNLQINWGGGNKFHMVSLDTAACSDDPNIDEGQPVAGFDTFEGTGTGRLNGDPGATVRFIFTDVGEPGKDDTAKVTITSSGGAVVLDVMGVLNRGNYQAHEE